METLIDELATCAKADPIAYRRKLLKADAARLHRPLDLMDEKSAAWRAKLPKGHALGISCHESFGTGDSEKSTGQRMRLSSSIVVTGSITSTLSPPT